MVNENVDLIHSLYEAYRRGDPATVLESVDPDLEWTYLDPASKTPSRGSATVAKSSRWHWRDRPNAA
jgi:ketosteroid isomerase-like protein